MSRPRYTQVVVTVSCLAMSPAAVAQSFSQGFDDITALDGRGWDMVNSSEPIGPVGYFQGNTDVFSAQTGPNNSYIAANYQNTAVDPTGMPSTISNWLILPEVLLSDNDQLSFYTRTVNTPNYPDRLQVRLSLNGGSTDTGGSATTVGDFSTLLLDINPTYSDDGYPNAWTRYDLTLSQLPAPTMGRIALRYFCESAGPEGDNSDYIGIDSLTYTAVPDPATLALLLTALGLRRGRLSRGYPPHHGNTTFGASPVR